MATIHKEIEIDCKLEGDWRTVKFGNGMIVRELIVAVDDKTCRDAKWVEKDLRTLKAVLEK